MGGQGRNQDMTKVFERLCTSVFEGVDAQRLARSRKKQSMGVKQTPLKLELDKLWLRWDDLRGECG